MPGLFRGRGEHPRMGKIKRRVYPRDITINIGKDEPVPEHPFPGGQLETLELKEEKSDALVGSMCECAVHGMACVKAGYSDAWALGSSCC